MYTRKPHRTAFTTLAVLAGTLALLVAPANAFTGHPLVSRITGPSVSEEFVEPWDLTFDASGNLFITDANRAVVDVFDAANAFKGQAGQGFLSGGYARGVAVDDATGDIYVGDSNLDEVFVMKPDGHGGYEGLAPAWTGAGSPLGSFGAGGGYVYTAFDNSTNPSDTHAGDLYVLTTQGVVDIYRPQPQGVHEAEEGEFVGQLTPPSGFAFESVAGLAVNAANGEVYVTDWGHNVIDEFSSSGAYLGSVNGSETPAGSLVEPVGVAVESSTEDIFVIDRGSQVVDQFDAAGKYVGQISGLSTGSAFEPVALAVNAAGQVYVTDRGSESRSVDVFGPTTTLPGVDTGASVVHPESVSVAGSVNPAGTPTTYHFVYGTTAAYGSSTAVTGAGSGSSDVAVGATLTGLISNVTAGTVYHYRLVAENAHGVSYGQDFTFESPLTVDGVQTEPASAVLAGSATLNGSLKPDGLDAHYYFEYGENEEYGAHSPALPGIDVGSGGPECEPPGGVGCTKATAQTGVSGLIPNTSYDFRLVGVNGGGTTYGANETFTTAAVPPVIDRVPGASNVGRASALVHGVVDPEHSSTSYHIDYVRESDYAPGTPAPYAAGGVTAPASAGAGYGDQAVEQVVGGLTPDTTYHYAIVAVNQAGQIVSQDQMFTTGSGTPPSASTGPASDVAQNSATISGAVNTQGLPTTYGFELGMAGGTYGPPTGLGSIGAGASDAIVTLSLTSLEPGVSYHYRLTATNVDGTTHGSDQEFTTTVFASVLATPPAPLPFVAVPGIAFPPQTPGSLGSKKSAAKKPAAKRKRKQKPSKKKPSKKQAKRKRQLKQGKA